MLTPEEIKDLKSCQSYAGNPPPETKCILCWVLWLRSAAVWEETELGHKHYHGKLMEWHPTPFEVEHEHEHV